MTTILTPTTELEAVNKMLAAIGESPVNSVTNSGLTDATNAYTLLGQVCREVQSRSYYFNSEKEYPLALDNNGFCYLPTNTLRVRIADTMAADFDVTQRGNRLYDRYNHTFVFTQNPIKVDITFLLTFEDMPEAARWYTTIRAGRMFLDGSVGSADLHGFQAQDEMEALSVLKEFEGDVGNYNILTGSYDVYRVIDRDAPLHSLIVQ